MMTPTRRDAWLFYNEFV